MVRRHNRVYISINYLSPLFLILLFDIRYILHRSPVDHKSDL